MAEIFKLTLLVSCVVVSFIAASALHPFGGLLVVLLLCVLLRLS